jgi:hypothetical protein
METNDELNPNTKKEEEYQHIKDKKMKKEGKHRQIIKKNRKLLPKKNFDK